MLLVSTHAMPSRLKMVRDGRDQQRESVVPVRADLNVHIFALTQSRGLMRVFGSIVQSFVLSMLSSRQDLTFRRTLACERISDDDTRNVVESFEEPAEKSCGCFFVSAALDEDVEHVAIVIHGSPENVLVSTNGKHDPRPIYRVSPQRGRRRRKALAEVWPNAQTPVSKCFIGHDHPALCAARSSTGPKTEREAKIEPDAMTDDLRWETDPL